MSSLQRIFCMIAIIMVLSCGIAAASYLLTHDAGYAANEKTVPAGGKQTEDEIFSDSETITPSEKVKDDTISDAIEKKSVSFNGFLNSRTSAHYLRGTILRELKVLENSNFLSYFQGNFTIDARLLQGVKGYVNVSADYYPAGLPKSRVFEVPLTYLGIPAYFTKTDFLVAEKVNAVFSMNEIFLDVNIARRIYFRIGKQVVKWGVGYLWTPTDLINIEKKNILDWSQVRQGTYGLKIHVPFGTVANLYSFIDFFTAKNLSDISMANKIEFLIKDTEMSFSAILKKKNVPVYGYDITTRILGIDVHGEASLSYGDNKRKARVYPWFLLFIPSGISLEEYYLIQTPNSVMDTKNKGRWMPRASVGFGRGFEVRDIKDRVRIDFEFFYNHAGYERNMFEKDILMTSRFLSLGMFEPNYYGKYYAGAFITIQQLFVSELSGMVNCIVNVLDQSSVIMGMLTYVPVYDLTLNLAVTGYVGKKNREYTVMGNYLNTELSIKIVF